jgi:hypothetical protein
MQIKTDTKEEWLKVLTKLFAKKITRQELSLFKNLVEEKDLHILTGAILTSCQYLVTLDKKHLNNQKVKKNYPNKN